MLWKSHDCSIILKYPVYSCSSSKGRHRKNQRRRVWWAIAWKLNQSWITLFLILVTFLWIILVYSITCNASTWSSLLFILLCGFSQLPQWFSCRSHKSSQYKWSIFCSFEYVSSCALSKIWRWHFVILNELKKQLGCFQRKDQEFKSSNLNWPRSGMLDSLQRKK